VVGENIAGPFGTLTRKEGARVVDASLESESKGFGVGSGIEGQSSIPELESSWSDLSSKLDPTRTPTRNSLTRVGTLGCFTVLSLPPQCKSP
jgi:hypothetical protein